MENKELSSKIGKKIKLVRESKSLSQDDLASISGLGVNSIGLIERGATNPTLHSLNQIACALGVDIVELFNFSI